MHSLGYSQRLDRGCVQTPSVRPPLCQWICVGWQVHSVFRSFSSLFWSVLSVGLFCFSLVHMCRLWQPWVCGWPEPASVSALHACTSGVYRVLIKPRWLSYLLELPVKSLATPLFAPNRTTTSLSLVCLPLSSQVNLQCIISNESPLAVTTSLVPWVCCCPG